ncbi:zinc-binding dehydrogenase [Streptomyces sp. HNM1019]|uniref:zinc-binding dehydrogenase n=1 Tax=Streptomyces sp. HNM1019 TaxID=3424717 RepID=UPI003D78A20B
MTVGQRRVARATAHGEARDVIEVATEPIPELGATEALVKVAAITLNHSEILAVRGGKYAEGLELPFPLGYEGAGTVVATGAEVDLAVGTRVAWTPVPASTADYVVAHAGMLVPIPDTLPLEECARVPSAGMTAQLLAGILPLYGKSAVVWGAAGPVGRFLTAFLVEAGVEVIGVASGDRVRIPTELGATYTVDRRQRNVRQAVLEHTKDRGVAAVFDPIGAAAYQDNLAMLAPQGCLVNYGQLSGELPTVDLTDLMERGLFVTKLGGGSAYLDSLEALHQLIVNALDMLTRKPLALADSGGTYTLDRVADAYEALSANREGKIMVIP